MMEQRNLLLAIVFSVSVLLGYQFLFEQPRIERERAAQQAAEAERRAAGETVETGETASPPASPPAGGAVVPGLPGGTVGLPQAPGVAAPAPPAANEPRVQIVSSRLKGSLSLKGARIDDLLLTDYRETIEEDSPQITLFAPPGSESPYFAQFGWVATDTGVATPTPETVWASPSNTLEPERPLALSWNNGAGLVFTQEITLDRDYMFKVTQRVTNRGESSVGLRPYGLVSRTGEPDTLGFWILHEGLLGVFGDTLKEVDYDDVSDADDGMIAQDSTGGWIGITDKFWLAALIPDQETPIASRFVHTLQERTDKYQVDVLGPQLIVQPGATVEVTKRLFAGAKEVRLLDAYEEELGIVNFDLAVDFGWFYFLTKPIFYVLEYFNRLIGNFGVAILLLTVLIKIAFFPLANKSYRAMSRLKKLQPEMMKIRDRFKEDRQRQNQEMMALYKKENANPVSGCFPILIQIPVFFALYKVLFVSIEMRHAPFFGWIQDLSAPDPLGILTAFGLIDWSIPELLQIANIGIWPLIMGGTMYLQQKLNPQPADPTQAKIFLMLPIVFTFMLGQFPAGLVVYWAWNNLLSIAQQWIIMRQMGVTISGQTVALPGGKTKPDSGTPSGAKPASGPARAKRRKKASAEEAPPNPPKRRPGNNKRKRPRRKAS
ncbi:MAG: membrane protein insertase YidC [Defluviicoccus sp.]|nr:membrane protein insertase YidC [Defluviicoccus sp.]